MRSALLFAYVMASCQWLVLASVICSHNSRSGRVLSVSVSFAPARQRRSVQNKTTSSLVLERSPSGLGDGDLLGAFVLTNSPKLPAECLSKRNTIDSRQATGGGRTPQPAARRTGRRRQCVANSSSPSQRAHSTLEIKIR